MQSTKIEKVVFIFCNLALAVVWLHFLVRLITRWTGIPTNIRYDVGLFMMFFSLLWLMLIREKRNGLSILMAGAVFVTVCQIVRIFM